MRVLTDDDPSGDPRGSVVTIGVFDGVHRGHQSILEAVVALARDRDLEASVVTFDPHPATVLAPSRAPLQLESLSRRLARFGLLGVSQVRVIAFDEAASRESAESFVHRVLEHDLAARVVIVGEDFRFGRDRAGDVASLRAWGERGGFEVRAVPLVGTTEKFSSTAARYFVQLGDLDGAEAVLGHRFSVSGDVVHGDARGGRMLGFPTANLSLPSGVVHPGVGIYAGAARCSSGEWYPAAISVGRRPQFYVDGELLVEAHLVGFTGDLYGTSLDLVFIQWLRGEEIFSSVDELISQMGRDVAQSVAIYQNFADDPDSLLGFSLGQRR